MKIKFSKKVEYIPEWHKNRELPVEEQVKVILKPMKMADLFLAMDSFGTEGQMQGVVPASRMKEIMASAGHLISKYASIEGLEDDDGPVTTEAVSEFPVYLELASEILMELVGVSMPSEEDTKNSKAQPA